MRPEDFTQSKPENPEAAQMKSAFAALLEISNALNTDLDSEGLLSCIRLCELGIHPEILANVIKEIRLKVAEKKRLDNVKLDRVYGDGNRNV